MSLRAMLSRCGANETNAWRGFQRVRLRTEVKTFNCIAAK